ncbi:sugar phosphate isomerase/epimerase [Motilibacter rhizosphaerae]|uniref:Sugar phosphate isomerase/epimerase n=1 Tax=Motilibacter rhizosphaerae TaxID=598652 RepID=A0A4Q7NAD4_9ACTN|nr:TIM barrel protein [Motilibacter rhizosphaerae]RZS79049.1 sugar phosphate isomerase/epimerase [Motilibacter rhizosphaerae]
MCYGFGEPTQAAPAAPQAAPAPRSGERQVPLDDVSIQLYTLRTVLEDDHDAVMTALAGIGYRKVEAAGTWGRTAQELRGFLDGLGVRATSAHLPLAEDAAGLERKLADAVALGHAYVNVPFLRSESSEDWKRWADEINAEAQAFAEQGIRFGYHNHAHEYTVQLDDGTTPWDVLTSRCDPALVHLELDLHWVVTAGVQLGESDPVGYTLDVISAAPQRVRQYHVKDRHADTGDTGDLGSGMVDFARIFAAHQVEEWIVENDRPDVTPLRTAEVGWAYLSDIRF